MTLLLSGIPTYASAPNDAIQLIVDNKNITELSEPVIENGRVLVPIKFVSDAIGAEVTWDGDERTVLVKKGDKELLLWIGSRLIQYGDRGYGVSDVAPKIINDRTYVPLRVVSNALSIGIKWDGDTRSVYVDSSESSDIEAFYETSFVSLEAHDIITGETEITVSIPSGLNVAESKLLLLDPDTAKGFVVARDYGTVNQITYLPKVEDLGEKVLVLALYDSNRNFIAGDALPVTIDVNPEVTVVGTINNGSITIGQNVNFLARYINYEITQVETGETISVTKRDPVGTYSYTPSYEDNGAYSIKVTAFDGNEVPYESQSQTAVLNVAKRLSMGGVRENQTISNTVSIIASRNFDVNGTEYFMRDKATGVESLIAAIPYGAYDWTPTKADVGQKELYVRVLDTKGVYHTSAPVTVTIDFSPRVSLSGVGPNQVLTSSATLALNSNVTLDEVTYYLKKTKSGTTEVISSKIEVDNISTTEEFEEVRVYAKAMYQGQELISESITFKIYKGELYSARPVIEKSEFKAFASELALESFAKTGMSASLQTAQAILETGWGQSLPVDKYNGKFSYNLFGIKGSATNGSVVSNTWEVYNGKSFRVDANFRAYNNVEESWADHKRILLERSRYEPYREVMYDSTLGAFAVRRAGYATDPKYPIKLIDIIEMYDLKKLDEVGLE